MEQTTRPFAAPEAAAGRPLLRVSVAALLFLLVLALAAALRFDRLAAMPLNEGEAQAALATWRFWHAPDEAGGAAAISPAYFSAASPVVALFGGETDMARGDALARLAPALAGLLTVVLLWAARGALGLAGSLTAAFLLAVSPLAALISRQAGGDALALLALAALFLSALHFQREGGRTWPALAAAALGFGLATGPLFYSGLLALALAWLAQRRAAGGSPDGEKPEWRPLGLIAAAVFVGAATGLLLRPAGLAGAAAQLGDWLAAFALPATLRDFLAPLALLARYEPAALTLGAGAAVWGLWRGDALPRFLAVWYAAALALLLAQPGLVTAGVLLALPAFLLVGQWLQQAFRQPAGAATWGLAAFLLVSGVALYFNAIRFVRLIGGQQEALAHALVVALVLAVAVVTINVVRGWEAAAAWQGALLALLLLSGAAGLSLGWRLTHEAANDPRSGLGPATHGDVRLLVEMLHEISYQTGAERNGLPLLSAVDRPVLRWYLRQFSAAQFGATVPPGATTTALITLLDGPAPPVDDYTGLDLGLQNVGVEEGPPPALAETLRWWFFRESPAAVAQERVILWLRQDALPWSR